MTRSIVTHVAVLAAGLGAGLGAVAFAQPNAPEGHAASSDSRIVRELRTMNGTLKLINKNLGGYDNISVSPSIQDLLEGICRNTQGDQLSGC